MGNWPATGAVFNPLSPPHVRSKHVQTHCSQAECRLPIDFLLVLLAPQPTHGAILLCGRPQGWDIQHVVWITYSLRRISVYVTRFSTKSPLPVAQVPTFLPFVPDSVWIFLTALVLWESFCQLPVSILLIIPPHVDIFLMYSQGRSVPYAPTPSSWSPLLFVILIKIFHWQI